MKRYVVSVSERVFDEIDSISDFIIPISTPEHAIRYKNQLIAEIQTLSYLADAILFRIGKQPKNVTLKQKGLSHKTKSGMWLSILMAIMSLLTN